LQIHLRDLTLFAVVEIAVGANKLIDIDPKIFVAPF